MTSNEVDHSIDLSSDFSKFLFEEQLADIKIHVGRRAADDSNFGTLIQKERGE